MKGKSISYKLIEFYVFNILLKNGFMKRCEIVHLLVVEDNTVGDYESFVNRLM